MTTIFISYSREDSEVVVRLVRDLRAAGAEIWFDQTDQKPGLPFPTQIGKALKASECLVAVLSPRSVESKFAQAEWLTAFNQGKTIIPILIEEVEIPFFLSPLNYIEFLDDYERGLKRLAEALGVEPGDKPEVVPIQPPEAVPGRPAPAKIEAVPGPKSDDTGQQVREALAIDWIEIPAGPFTRGCPEEFIRRIEGKFHASAGVFRTYPWRQEQLERFWISKMAVTNSQYVRFVQETGHRSPEGWKFAAPFADAEADLPVTGVSWQDAADFAAWAGARLPTRAEVEKACRGTDGRIYPWGQEFEPGRCNTAEGGRRRPTRGDEFAHGASPYGVLDLVGNVWEWVDGGEQGLKMTVGASFGSTGEVFGAGFFDLSRPPDTRKRDVGFRFARS